MQIQRKIEIEILRDVHVIRISEKIISGVELIGELTSDVSAYLEQEKPRKVVIDFTDVTFLSSQMLGLLVHIWRGLQENGGRMVISGINPQLCRIFRITNLNQIFTFSRDVPSAIRRLGETDESIERGQ